MSTPETGERLVGEIPATPAVPATSARRASQLTRMLAWTGVDALRLEAARVVLGERSMRASGCLISARRENAEAYSASYSLATDESGVVQRLTVRTIRAQGEEYVSLARSEEGIWLVDRVCQGAGTLRTNFSGALDVDLTFSPLFNAIPVRRLGLHRAAAQHDLPVVIVSLPGLEVGCAWQTYRTVAVGETTVLCFTSDLSETEFTVDADGLVLDYPGLAHRG
ncbi:MAG TPA: putative glycolipid-binding domain-containing protein [Pseudonocardiaceae bacterium]|nr:putative glycolipid-binding domain-containing protein [Pseudonocardiaceae bacterium]